MIRVVCPGCGSKLNAKDELAGQTRNCPKCSCPVVIGSADAGQGLGLDDSSSGAHVQRTGEAELAKPDLPERLDRRNHYLICDKTKLVATWENNGNGWMLKTSFGLVSAVRNHEQLPAEGDFKLIELKLEMTDEGRRLAGITSYQLSRRWALTSLDKGDHQIAAKIGGFGFLNKDQKAAVRNAINEQFMRHVWEDADDVLDYLANTDYHSPGTVVPKKKEDRVITAADKQRMAEDFAQILATCVFEAERFHPSTTSEERINRAMQVFGKKYGLSVLETVKVIGDVSKYM